MPEPRSAGIRATQPGADRRSRHARVADGQPARFYDPSRGREEPAEVTAARERHRKADAIIAARQADLEARQSIAQHEESQPDPAPDPEWYRELADDDDPVPLLAWDEVAPATPGDGAATITLDSPEPIPAPPPDARCSACGYLTTTIGHKVTCGA